MAFLIIVLVAGLILIGVIVTFNPQAGGDRRRSKSAGGRIRVAKGRSAQGRVASYSREQLVAQWQHIIAVSQTGGAGLKSSILEADKLFDHALQMTGVPGETMGERLKNSRARFSSYPVYDGVWRAHKLRNALAHEMGFDLVASQVREALADFERGLRDLGVL